MAGIGASGVLLAQHTAKTLAQSAAANTAGAATDSILVQQPSVNSLMAQSRIDEGQFVVTAGFQVPGDGGGALYQVKKPSGETQPNDADMIGLNGGLVAVLQENEAVNYRMFGAIGDGEHDDGIQIKRAHEYANQRQIPVVNLSGEFWIKQTKSIPIRTNVQWGKTTFHIDERYNSRSEPRFIVENDEATETLTLDDETKAILLDRIKPGVQIISELAPYAGHLISVVDANDRIGIRAGKRYSKRGWAREELFYVEEEGRIIGDIAWQFKDFTSIKATPCNDNYLVIEGGGFYFSGNTPDGGVPGYYQLGISIRRSRTIVREQWMGLEPGKQDTSLEPRSGLYSLSGVYDVTLENIRAMPWEKNRRDREKAVKHGTYGIAGARMLNCTFRNITAEAGWVSWGVFGTNLNKNFRVENCRLNRVDVHFHCWNLYIRDSVIGFKGISVTGGGDLFIENTVRHGTSFVHFRPDYGAKWDGHVRIRGCTLRPTGDSHVSVLSYRPSDSDYQYPIGSARSIKIEDMIIDYATAPDSKSPCWLMSIASFSRTSDGTRLFFPNRIEFKNITVDGRETGVRLIRIPDPGNYDLRKDGLYDGNQVIPNCALICSNVQLEKLTPRSPKDTDQMHLVLTGDVDQEYADQRALYPRIRFTDCDNVCVYLGNCIASARFERCSVNTVTAPALQGDLSFADCHFQPNMQKAAEQFCTLNSTLGTRFTNCAIHIPIVDGKPAADLVGHIGFLEINKALQYSHLNTALGNDILGHLKSNGIELLPEFIQKLTSQLDTSIS